MAESLTLDGVIELCGGGNVISTQPQCPGAVFTLGGASGDFDFGAHQPVTEPVGSLILDGEYLTGTRSSNRTISLPVLIRAPTQTVLTGARELLLQTVNQRQWQMVWTRNGGQPLVFDCMRAGPASIVYSLTDLDALACRVGVSFEAKPFGRSDVPLQLQFLSPAAGSVAPPSPVTLDAYTTSGGWASGWSRSTQCAIGPYSAHWDSDIGGSGNYPTLTRTFGAANLTGLTALSWWVGLGNDDSWSGNVTFSWVLTDGTHTLTVGTTRRCTSSDEESSPYWQQVTAPLPAAGSFNLAAVTGYTFTAWSSSGRLFPDDLYLDAFTAVPTDVGGGAGVARHRLHPPRCPGQRAGAHVDAGAAAAGDRPGDRPVHHPRRDHVHASNISP